MGTFPITYGKALPTKEPSLARGDVRAAGEVGRAVAGLGEAVFEIGQQRKERDNLIALSNAVAGLDAFKNTKLLDATQTRFATIQQIDELDKSYDAEFEAEMQKLSVGLDADTVANFQAVAIRNRESEKFRYSNVLYARKKEIYEMQLGLNLQTMFNSEPEEPPAGMPEAAQENYHLMHAQWQAKYNAMITNYSRVLDPDKVEKQTIYSLINAERFDDAETALGNVKFLSPQDVTALDTRIRTSRAAFENQQKTLADIYTEQAHKTAVAELVKDIDNIEFVNTLPPSLQEFWQAKLNKRTKGLEEDIDTFNQTNAILYSGLKQAIRETPDEVDYMDIVGSVGNGLTPVQAQELFELQDKMQEKDNPLNQSHIKRAHDRISDLQGAGLEVKGMEVPTSSSSPEEIIKYYNVFDEMHEAIDKNVEASPAEMRTYTEEMVKPLMEEAGKGFWGTLWSWTPIGMATKVGGAYIQYERAMRTRPANREDFEMKFKRLYKVNPGDANKYWDRWENEW